MFVCAHHDKNTLCLSLHQHLVARVVAVVFSLGRLSHLNFTCVFLWENPYSYNCGFHIWGPSNDCDAYLK